MRRLHKNSQAPASLRQQGQAEAQKLIQAVNDSQEPVFTDLYKRADVKKQLRKDQNGKCAYCERYYNGDFGAVEHYRPKGECQQSIGGSLERPGYYWLAYEWDNLLYSCSECNTSYKRSLFPLENPGDRDVLNRDISRERPLLINPSVEDPADFITFKSEIAVPRLLNGQPCLKGQTTIDVLGLNKRADLKQRRFEALLEYKMLLKIKAILSFAKLKPGLALIDKYIDRHTNENAEFTGMFHNQG